MIVSKILRKKRKTKDSIAFRSVIKETTLKKSITKNNKKNICGNPNPSRTFSSAKSQNLSNSLSILPTKVTYPSTQSIADLLTPQQQ